MKAFTRGLATLALLLATPAYAAESNSTTARTDVDLALVLAVGSSASVNLSRFQLQMQGYAEAFRAPAVVMALHSGPARSIVATMIHWSSPDEQLQVVGWTKLSGAESAHSFASAILKAGRRFNGGTSISSGIEYSLLQLTEVSRVYKPRRSVIDVSGDGDNNAGHPIHMAREAAVAQGVTINGLPILGAPVTMNNPFIDLEAYYKKSVIVGQGSFVMVAKSYDDFGEAVQNKLVQEIAGKKPESRLAFTR